VKRQSYIMRERLTFCILLLVLFCTTLGCHDPSGLGDRRFSLDDETLRPFAAMYEVDRNQYCLTEIDPDSIVHIERRNYGDYGSGVILHIEGDRTYRTVTFVQEQGEYVWIGEQELHYSGRTYMTPDGELNERIVVTYYERTIDSQPAGLSIFYAGAHETISANPTCEEALRVIRHWHEKEPTPNNSQDGS
jgi:hypothetical protein